MEQFYLGLQKWKLSSCLPTSDENNPQQLLCFMANAEEIVTLVCYFATFKNEHFGFILLLLAINSFFPKKSSQTFLGSSHVKKTMHLLSYQS